MTDVERPGEGDWPRCPAFFAGLADVLVLTCGLPEGHPGYHRDPLEGVEWQITRRDGHPA